MTQQIIVYRNPIEASFWNFIYNEPTAGYWISGIIGAMVAIVAILWLWNYIDNKIRNKNRRDW